MSLSDILEWLSCPVDGYNGALVHEMVRIFRDEMNRRNTTKQEGGVIG